MVKHIDNPLTARRSSSVSSGVDKRHVPSFVNSLRRASFVALTFFMFYVVVCMPTALANQQKTDACMSSCDPARFIAPFFEQCMANCYPAPHSLSCKYRCGEFAMKHSFMLSDQCRNGCMMFNMLGKR
jgi:hypothetical protein